jgi:hypothetical protein
MCELSDLPLDAALRLNAWRKFARRRRDVRFPAPSRRSWVGELLSRCYDFDSCRLVLPCARAGLDFLMNRSHGRLTKASN